MFGFLSNLNKPYKEDDVSDIAIPAGVEELVLEPGALADAYGAPSVKDLVASPFLVICSLAAALGGFLFGFDQGLISVILGLRQFLDVFPEVDADVSSSAGFLKGLMTAMLELGAAVGALQSGFAADKISRKYTLFLGTAWFFLGSAMQTGASDYAVLVVGRTLGGVGIGTLACVAPIYISEVAPPHLRGLLLVFESLMITTGLVVAFFVSYGCRNIPSDWSFRLPFLLQMAPAVILCALFALMPFSPRWLCSKGRSREALNSLARLRQLPEDDPKVMAEWISIRGDVENERLATQLRHPGVKPESLKAEALGWADCWSRKVWRRTIIGVGLQCFQQLIGVNAVIYYSPSLFEALGYEREKQLIFSGIANVMQVIGVGIAMGIIDRVGRKKLLYFGSMACLAAHATIAALIGIYSDDWPSAPEAASAGVALIMLFMFVFGTSWSPIPWAMPPEVMPSTFRSKGVALSTVTNWIFNFIIGLITPILIEETNWGTFVFFAAFAFLSLFFNWFFIVETKGVRLEEMDKQFNDNSNHEDNLRLRDILFSLVSGRGITPRSTAAFKNKNVAEIEHQEFTDTPATTGFDSSEKSSAREQPL